MEAESFKITTHNQISLQTCSYKLITINSFFITFNNRESVLSTLTLLSLHVLLAAQHVRAFNKSKQEAGTPTEKRFQKPCYYQVRLNGKKSSEILPFPYLKVKN